MRVSQAVRDRPVNCLTAWQPRNSVCLWQDRSWT